MIYSAEYAHSMHTKYSNTGL